MENFYRNLIEKLPLEIAIYDSDGRFTYSNEAVRKLFRLENEGLEGKTFYDVFEADIAGAQHKSMLKVFSTGQPLTLERRFTLHGQTHYFQVLHQPIFDKSGKVTSVMVIGQNFTVQKREEILFSIQNKIDALGNLSISLSLSLKKAFQYLLETDWIDMGGVYLFDEKRKKLKLVYSTGLSKNYIKEVKVFYAQDVPVKAILKRKSRYINSLGFLEPIKNIMVNEGLTFVATIPLVYKKQVIGSMNLGSTKVNDISWHDRKIIESIGTRLANLIMLIKTREQLISTNTKLQKSLDDLASQNQLLIQKSRLESLGELAAGLAHEINQPLAVISLVVENLHYKFDSKSKETEYLSGKFDSIFQNINKIRELIDHFRIFSRDQGVVMFDKVDVNRAILGALSMIGVELKNHQINVITDLSCDLGYTLGNLSRLEQVILNLLSNARDAINEKAERSTGMNFIKEIRIRTYCKDSYINISVRDTGTGIPVENRDKIFDPFFSTKAEGRGSGLGLAIVYGIITEMNGTITVRSEKNSFTEILIRLPANKK